MTDLLTPVIEVMAEAIYAQAHNLRTDRSWHQLTPVHQAYYLRQAEHALRAAFATGQIGIVPGDPYDSER